MIGEIIKSIFQKVFIAPYHNCKLFLCKRKTHVYNRQSFGINCNCDSICVLDHGSKVKRKHSDKNIELKRPPTQRCCSTSNSPEVSEVKIHE